jgi:hypothetical protein
MSLYLRAHPAVHEFGKVETEENFLPITWRHRVLVGNPEGKRPLGRPRCRWVDNSKMDE